MPAPDAAHDHYTTRKRRAVNTAAYALAQWDLVDRHNIARSWLRLIPGVAAAMTAAQLASAQEADPYLDEVAPGSTVDALVSAAAFAGAAADGRSLLSLLFRPVILVLRAIFGGASVERAMAGGAATLDMIVRTEVADAGRVADQVAMVVRPHIDGYIRVIVGDTCNRCIILAGRWYPVSEGFRRHPRCDCVMLPAAQAQAASLVQDPQAIYEAMTHSEREKAGWSRGDQEAIALGADLNQVTNAHRGTYTAGGRRHTREGITRRGVFGGFTVDPQTGQLRRRQPGEQAEPRLAPGQIFEDASDREEAISLLTENGYLLEPAQVKAAEQIEPTPKAPDVPEPDTLSSIAAAQVAALPDNLFEFFSHGVALDEGQDLARGWLGEIAELEPGNPRLTAALNTALGEVDDARDTDEIVDAANRLAAALSGPAADPLLPPGQVLIADLIPASFDAARNAGRKTLQALRGRLNGFYAGLRVEIDIVNAERDRIQFTAKIYSPDGRRVGSTGRSFSRGDDSDSEQLWVAHILLELEPSVQGQGFAQAWNDHLAGWYRESGVAYIRVHANIDVGGYTWARQGFDWADDQGPTDIASRLAKRLGPPLGDEEINEAQDMIERLRQPRNSPDFPDPYEVSQLGRKAGQGRRDAWIGKSALLGSSWKGIKWL